MKVTKGVDESEILSYATGNLVESMDLFSE